MTKQKIVLGSLANFSHRDLSAPLRLWLALLFAFIGSPAAAYINGIAKVGSLSGSTLTNPVYTPANVSAPTSAVIKVTVSDGAATTSQNITLTVNDTPVVATVTITYYHNDALGSPIAATSPTGNLLWRESYRPYGERLDNQAAGATNPIWYTGKRQDPETGLVYMGARYYNPALGRFLSIDPVGPDENNLHSLNRYAYANNNPYRFTDPDGNIPIDTVWDAGNVVYDLGKAAYGAATNNPALVAQGLGDAAADTAAMLIPYVPAGSTKVARRVAEKAAGSPLARGRASEQRVLSEMGLPKNTQKVRTSEGTSIPDGLTKNRSVEIKDCISVSCTRQIRIQTKAARNSGRESTLVTGTNTRVSENTSRAFDKIDRRPDLGPK